MERKIKLPLWARIVLMVLILLLYPALNILIDPFGVFGDPVFDWYSYNEYNNPRAAKIAWLEEHHGEFDSYIIGSSCAAAINPLELNEYMDARFYNLFSYGSDMHNYRANAAYILEHYEVKNLVLNLNLTEVSEYDIRKDDIHYRTHALVSGESLPLFYLRYALCAPRYALEKVQCRFRDTWLPQEFDCFDVPTGCYDKRVRDVEKIGDPAVYDSAHGGDFQFYAGPSLQELPHLEECIRDLTAIRDLCAEKGVNLLVICSPAYTGQLEAYGQEALARYKTAVAQVVDFWDFSCSSLSCDSRYFYDASHFRNAVGTMVLAEIFQNGEIYRPADFGTLVTAENCAETCLRPLPQAEDPAEYTRDVPILMYHHFSEDEEGAVTPEEFAGHLEALSEAGYTAVTMQELTGYVYHGGALPDKPVCITFDDGYLSNYQIAWPLLERYGMKATIFAIGSSVGHEEFYKDTRFRLIPHFGYGQAREMLASGAVDIQSHSYDLHQWADFETGDEIRTSALPLPGESEEHYAEVLERDLSTYGQERIRELGEGFTALAYPGGYYNTLTEVLIHRYGIPVTLSIDTDRRNVLVRGLPQSLYALCRWNVTPGMTGDEVVTMITDGQDQ